MKKRILVSAISFLLALMTLAFTACSGKQCIEVVSQDYPGLVKMEICSEELTVDYLLESGRWRYITVSEQDGKLLISKFEQPAKTHVAVVGDGYLMGFDLGEFDGWVRYFKFPVFVPEDSDPNGGSFVQQDPVFVTDENCCGIADTEDSDKKYFLT